MTDKTRLQKLSEIFDGTKPVTEREAAILELAIGATTDVMMGIVRENWRLKQIVLINCHPKEDRRPN